MAHLEPDAFVKFPGDQSISYNHHHPGDCKQHKQEQNVPGKNKLIYSKKYHMSVSNVHR